MQQENLRRAQTKRFKSTTVPIAELHFKSIPICQYVYDRTDLPSPQLAFWQVYSECNDIKQFDFLRSHLTMHPKATTDNRSLVEEYLNRVQ